MIRISGRSTRRFLALVVSLLASTVSSHGPCAASSSPRHALTFEERVAAQTAIERIYWAHRTWPSDNPGPKPPLEAVMPQAAIRSVVESYLKKSRALEAFWTQPITADQLQAEMRRMARETRSPDMLRELFAALDDDPYRIAECLARPALADRLLRSWYSRDEREHGELRRSAERMVSAAPGVAEMQTWGGEYRESVVKRNADDADPSSESSSIAEATLDPSMTADDAPLNRPSAILETSDAFVVNAVLERSHSELRVATVTWAKRPFDDWWSEQSPSLPIDSIATVPSESFQSVQPAIAGCVGDTWTPTLKDQPGIHYRHVGVWTGSEMLVWGGSQTPDNSVYRYDPATDRWTASQATGAPENRESAVGVWTGTEMLVWGGNTAAGTRLATGGRYRPTTDSWLPISTTGVPTARTSHAGVWTGSRLVVWGGTTGGSNNDGGRYDPATDSWTPTSSVGAPTGRRFHTAVWTGDRMIVYGGEAPDSSTPADGASYDPVTDTWFAIAPGPPTLPRYFHAAVWTGSEMVIWGGGKYVFGVFQMAVGGKYSPTTDSWTDVNTVGEPPRRANPTGIWTGSRMVVWAGHTGNNIELNGGGLYDPVGNTWQTTSAVNEPSPRKWHSSVWTGSRLIVWGGSVIGDPVSGGQFNPVANSWTPTGEGTVPHFREGHTAVWTGAEVILWGGRECCSGTGLTDGRRYDPVVNTWNPMSTANAPPGRPFATMVWTGTEAIVWGGGYVNDHTNLGGRYNPQTNTWTATTLSNAPSTRYDHSAVWTGTEMVVWGGSLTANQGLNSGGRYRPSTNSWTPTTLTDAPSARVQHKAVWTGSRMIIWGGYNGMTSGGLYDPVSDSWTATSLVGVPSPRGAFTSVWTGKQMVVWGGTNTGSSPSDITGGLYDPDSNIWSATTTNGAPPARMFHTAIWTGEDMVVWGGGTSTAGSTAFADGARYSPSSNSWTPTAAVAAPTARFFHTAVWTGSTMMVWGGTPQNYEGGNYCVCPDHAVVYRDADGDGYGTTTTTTHNCFGALPAGYVLVAGDCDDSHAAVHPGAPEVCDGLNDDCSSPSWPQPPANDADADQDGVTSCGGDCDDTRAPVRPGAPQVCDGLNNDCSDPSWPTPPPSDADGDSDGYRNCAGDCNDADPAIHPDATEACNGIDDDCNGSIDDDALGADTDADGVRNACDNCRTVPNPTQFDSDADHVGNACDNCIAVANSAQTDGDGDMRGDVCDNCPGIPNLAQDDGDHDATGDACDDCPFDYDPTQSDTNHDGEGDVCDLDDGLIFEFREDKMSVSWQAEQGPATWNLYIGDLATLKASGVYTQAEGSNALATRSCGLTSLFGDDLLVPAPGGVSFSLVTGVTAGVEGSLGSSSGGTRPNANPCP